MLLLQSFMKQYIYDIYFKYNSKILFIIWNISLNINLKNLKFFLDIFNLKKIMNNFETKKLRIFFIIFMI